MAEQLPKFIIIQSNFNDRYLHFEKDNPTVADALRFDGDYSYGLETRFEVVPATTGKGLVHIRSQHNNKFWVNSEGHNIWITATAVKPEEDQSSQCCTLFRPVYLDSNSNKIVQLLHVHTSYYVSCFKGSNHINGGLHIISKSQLTDQRGVFTILDWQSIVVLPNLIRIKGDNGKHLMAYGDGFMDYNNDVTNSPDFEYEVFPSRNGGICLKSIKYGKYWELENNSTWVLAKGNITTDHHINTVFIPTKLGENTIALLCLANNSFCKRLSLGNKGNCLAADIPYADDCSPMVIEEPVLSRTIDNVIYQLPKFIIIQSNFNHRYLHFEKDNPTVADALRFDGDYSYGLETRFEVVPATTGKGLVHIRSQHNNKFWVNSEGHNSWITATAVKPEEDQSSQCCTLFRPVYLDSNSNKIVRLLHVHTSYYVACFMGPNHSNGCLNLISNSQLTDQRDLFTILDWQSIVVLPNLIRIKGDNGKHLMAYSDGFMDYNNDVANSPNFEFEVFPSRNGGICLKSIKYGKYWKLEDHSTFVLARGNITTDHHINTVFIPTKLGENTIALLCLANNSFCKRLSLGNKGNCLAADIPYADDCSPMVIEEPVLSRTIDNVIYHLTDAKIYDEHVAALANEEARNKKQQHPDTVKLNLKHTETYTREWTASVSFGLSFKPSLSVGLPKVGELKIETTYEFKTSYQWGGRNEDKLEMGSEYTVTVPPMSSVKVSLMATRASCDIPFSYTQRDVLTNGSIKVYHKNDGLFKGRNAYNYRYESSQHDLE